MHWVCWEDFSVALHEMDFVIVVQYGHVMAEATPTRTVSQSAQNGSITFKINKIKWLFWGF
jgi:hypothetical protein